ERRLAYVGITRARRRAWITHAANRQIYGNWVSAIPSRFIDELPSAHVDLSAETGLSGGAGRSRHWDSSGISARDGYSSRPTVSERTGKATVPGEASFIRGGRVHHDKFGSGTVVHIDGHKLDIKFDQAGQKRVMDSFVTIVE
ncbi:MAG: DNA helicase II, partial [Alphaproteobacteria bacterium]|nr:DNA helicase II [Alphaproteobacteria bacterium]